MKRWIALVPALLLVAACSTTCPVPPTVEQPTPQVITLPAPTPTIVEVPVAGMPQSCIDFINALQHASLAQTDAYNEMTQRTLDAANAAIELADSLRAPCMKDANLVTTPAGPQS